MLPSSVVSIVVPACNAEATIRYSIQSALNQESAQIKLVVCDDGSTDKTKDILAGISDPRLKLIFNDSNLGPGPSRDRAIAESDGDWIAFLDADDAWMPNRLRTLLEAANATGADVAFDDLMMCHETADGPKSWRRLHGERAFGCGGGPSQPFIHDYIRSERLLVKLLIRTEFVRKHGIRHSARRFAEDAEFVLQLGHAGARFCYVPEPMYLYRITPGSLTAQTRDPTLMRRCLEECAQWKDWSNEVLDAFEQKITALKRNEALYALADAMRSRQFISAFHILASFPGLLRELPPRLLRQIDYQWHRYRHGGHRR